MHTTYLLFLICFFIIILFKNSLFKFYYKFDLQSFLTATTVANVRRHLNMRQKNFAFLKVVLDFLNMLDVKF